MRKGSREDGKKKKKKVKSWGTSSSDKENFLKKKIQRLAELLRLPKRVRPGT